eukprot:Hpha_TRINITY_DN35802_c0_g1::TRINITY_DN35802_c0_g1_i1::g.84866::m.84866
MRGDQREMQKKQSGRFPDVLLPPSSRKRRGGTQSPVLQRRLTLQYLSVNRGRRPSDVGDALPHLFSSPALDPGMWHDLRIVFTTFTTAVQPAVHHDWISQTAPGGPPIRTSWSTGPPVHVGGMLFFPDASGYLLSGEPFIRTEVVEREDPPDLDWPACSWLFVCYTSLKSSGPERKHWKLQVISRATGRENGSPIMPGASPLSPLSKLKSPLVKGTLDQNRVLLRLLQVAPDSNAWEYGQRRGRRATREIGGLRGPVRKPLPVEQMLRLRNPFLFRRVLEHPLHILDDAIKLVRKGVADFGEMRLLYMGMHQLLRRVRRLQKVFKGWIARKRVGYLLALRWWNADEERRDDQLIEDGKKALDSGDKVMVFISRLERKRLRVPPDVKDNVVKGLQSAQLAD